MSLFSYLYKIFNNMKAKEPLPGAKAFLCCVHEREAPQYTCSKGSLTVEAAIILPLFVGFFSFLLFYFQVMNVQLIVQNALEKTGRSMAILAAKELEESESGLNYFLLAKGMLSQELKDEEIVERYVKGGAAGVGLLTSEFDEEHILLNANYIIKFPVNFFGTQNFFVHQKSLFRKWNGWKSLREQSDPIALVYVTEYGEVYHMRHTCPYLDLSIQKITYLDLREKRNVNGEKYEACDMCTENGTFLSSVYITNYGEKYHYEINCSGLKRTVYQKKLSEVGGMAACRKCSK